MAADFPLVASTRRSRSRFFCFLLLPIGFRLFDLKAAYANGICALLPRLYLVERILILFDDFEIVAEVDV